MSYDICHVFVIGDRPRLKLKGSEPFNLMKESKKMGLLFHKANKGLALMKELFEAGKVVPVIDRCYPLNEVAEALRYYGEGRVKGKIVINMQHDN